MNHQQLQNALDAIDPAVLDYNEWLNVGMSLHSEGCDYSMWDEWSQRDIDRYDEQANRKKWSGFDANRSGGVTAGTILHIAERFGYRPQSDRGEAVGWGDVVQVTTATPTTTRSTTSPSKPDTKDYGLPKFEKLPDAPALDQLDMGPADMLKAQLRAMFQMGEYVNVVPKPNHMNGKTEAVELLTLNADEVLRNTDANSGAYVCINPVKEGTHHGSKNVTAWRNGLVECDSLDIDEQLDLMLKLHLPCRCITFSGGKSMHAVVAIDANSESEFKERILALYDYCEKNGLHPDYQCKNPSRLSRLAGATRGEFTQRLVSTGVGPQSWSDFVSKVTALAKDSDIEDSSTADDEIFNALDRAIKSTEEITGENRLPIPPSLVRNLIPSNSICMIAGPSKSSKTYFLMQLAQNLSDGTPFMGEFPCMKCRVFYVNIEIDEGWASQRIDDIRMKIDAVAHYDEITLRGELFTQLTTLREWLGERHRNDYDVIIIDPLYLFEQGDENSADTMIPLMLELKGIRDTCDCTLIFSHHYQKYWSNQLPEMRPAGSSVLHRFIDEGIYITPRHVPDNSEEHDLLEDYARMAIDKKAFASEFATSSRNYSCDLDSIVFAKPLFYADTSGNFSRLPIRGSTEARAVSNPQRLQKREDERVKKDIATGRAIDKCKDAGIPATRPNVLKYLGDECQALGISSVTKDTFVKWTQNGGPTHYRVDQSQGNILRPVDLEKADDDGNAPFLPTEEEVLASDGALVGMVNQPTS